MDTRALTRQIVLLLVMVGAAVVALYWSNRPDSDAVLPPHAAGPVTVSVLAHAETDTLLAEEIALGPPATVLAALQQAADSAGVPLALRTYDFGRLVVSIGGVTSGAEGDWTYTVNGDFMPVGADDCYLADGDRLEFTFGAAPVDSL